ncbi:MAG: hypothetical protein FJ100_19485 [Deltaproteobacteria bacterium]|nr:hypothetical protein [Deltaproteobacteria bacterium]
MHIECDHCHNPTSACLTACEACGYAHDPLRANGPDELPWRWPTYGATRRTSTIGGDSRSATAWHLLPPLAFATILAAAIVVGDPTATATSTRPAQSPPAPSPPTAAPTPFAAPAVQAAPAAEPETQAADKPSDKVPEQPRDPPAAAPAAAPGQPAAAAAPPPAAAAAPPPASNDPGAPLAATAGKAISWPSFMAPLAEFVAKCTACPPGQFFGVAKAVVAPALQWTAQDRPDEARPYLDIALPAGTPAKWDGQTARSEAWFYEGRLAALAFRGARSAANDTDWKKEFGGPATETVQQGARGQITVQLWRRDPMVYVVKTAPKSALLLVADAGLYAALAPKELAVAESERLVTVANGDLDAGLPVKPIVADLTRATELAPTSGLAWARLAKGLYRAQDYPGTLQACAKVRALSKSEFNLSLAAFYEAMVAVQRDDKAAGVAKLDEGIAIDPNSPSSKMRRSALLGTVEDAGAADLYAELECARAQNHPQRMHQVAKEFGLDLTQAQALMTQMAQNQKWKNKADSRLASKQCGVAFAQRKD